MVVDANGFPVEELLAFVVSKDGATRSTLVQYVRVLAAFAEYLQHRGRKSLLEATSRDLSSYRLYRTQTMASPVSDYSFRVDATALRQFYCWATETGLLRRSPVKRLSRRGRDNLSTNRIRHTKIRHVDNYLYVELLSAAGDSVRTDSVRRSPERNMAAIRVFSTTGLRLQELSSLLTVDIECAAVMRTAISVEMESITKGKINRNAVIPVQTMAAVHRYRKLERPNVVYRNQRSLRKKLPDCFVVESFDQATGRMSGAWKGEARQYPLHRVPVELRLKAVVVRADGWVEPLCLFLSESRGLGMTRSGWEGVFSEINDQMIRQNQGDERIRRVTPHDLRHTFAINFLRAALADRAAALQSATLGGSPPLRDPLIDLQELLGHATAAQTLRYLRYVEDIDRLVSAAVPADNEAEIEGYAAQK